jgi:hypothetical protein
MSSDPFKATQVQIGRILNAFSSDSTGNLIFADIPNPNGITLTQLIDAVNPNTVQVDTINILSTDFAPTSYSVDSGPIIMGFMYVISHNFDLSNPAMFTYNVVETSTGRVVIPQEIFAIDGNNVKLIMADTTPMTITIVGY